ncbi:MAG: DUF5060 domain-containing protein [Saprospiraceae bacterium]
MNQKIITKIILLFLLTTLLPSFDLLGEIPQVLFIKAQKDTVGLFEKWELSMNIKAEFNNPFDPGEIDISAKMISPSGASWNINGFYNYNSWQSLWSIRFSPNETGTWSYQLFIKDKNGTNDSTKNTFVVKSSSSKGPVYIAPNHRYLQYADGSPYFGVGLWYNDGYAAYNKGQVSASVLDDLQKLGVNFISSFITPFETEGSGLGRYDQTICGRLDEVLNMLEERDMQLSLNLWFHAYLSETVWPGGNKRWNSNPYKQITAAKDFYRSEEAWKYQEQMYRYMIARYSYSKSLMLWFVIDEVNGTDGWASGDSLQAAVWGKKVHDYFKKNDPYQHLTTGTRSGGIGEYWHEGYQVFDLPSREIYEAQGFPILKEGKINPGDEHPLTLSYLNYAGQVNKLWTNYTKPAIIGETGWDHTFYEPGMPGYLAMYHNALWVSMASGSAMTPFWWAYSGYLNDNIITNQIRSVSRFTKEIPFSRLTHVKPLDSISGGKNAFAISSDQLIFGWLVNPDADVANAEVKISTGNNDNATYKLRIYHTWRGMFLQDSDIQAINGEISFMVPSVKIEGGQGRYIGQDVAFILEKK